MKDNGIDNRYTIGVKKLFPTIPALIGLLLASFFVILWFPHTSSMWNNPIQQIDAPAHYYFIRKLLDEGITAATHLWPNDAYYPPFFHILCYLLIKIFSLFGVNLSIYAALNIVWLFSSAFLWPLSFLLFSLFITKRVFPTRYSHISPYISFFSPLISIASACHPYWMLHAGPLLAYGFATSLLLYWVTASLAWIETWGSENRNTAHLYFLLTLISGTLCLFAHPRIAFTWLLFVFPYILFRANKKIIISTCTLLLCTGVALLIYMKRTYKSDSYLNPSNWFHTFEPNKTFTQAAWTEISQNTTGIAGGLFSALFLVSFCTLIVSCFLHIKNTHVETHKYFFTPLQTLGGVLFTWVIISVIYVCSTAFTGWFANIVTAVWYRGETRPLTMLPLGNFPIIVLAIASFYNLSLNKKSRYGTLLISTSLCALIVPILFFDPTKTQLAHSINTTTAIESVSQDSQLTKEKYSVLNTIDKTVEKDATVISDPLNGSMYGTTLFGIHMLYPIYNPMAEKNGKIFGDVENAFASNNPEELQKIICPINPHKPEYFLSMGNQSSSLHMFSFKEQYYPFHDESLIDHYEAIGSIEKVIDFSHLGKDTQGWALYRFSCPEDKIAK